MNRTGWLLALPIWGVFLVLDPLPSIPWGVFAFVCTGLLIKFFPKSRKN